MEGRRLRDRYAIEPLKATALLLSLLIGTGACSSEVNHWVYSPINRPDSGCVSGELLGHPYSCGSLTPNPPFCAELDVALLSRSDDGNVVVDYQGSSDDFKAHSDEDCLGRIALVSDTELDFDVSDLVFEGESIR